MIIASYDVRGQSSAEIVATTEAAIDAIIEDVLENNADLLRAHGATDEEVEIELRRVHLECLRQKRDYVQRVRVGLLD